MIKKEIVEKISKYFKLTEFEAEKVYEDIFSIIMAGVKEDNIVDITDFGEFIIKFNNGKNGNGDNGSGYKKTVEFLASSNIEDELNPVSGFEQPSSSGTTGAGKEETDESSTGSIEEELRRKREEIISKISGPVLQKPPEMKIETGESKPQEVKEEESKPEPVKEETKQEPVDEEVKSVEDVKEEPPPVPVEEQPSEKQQVEPAAPKEEEIPGMSKDEKGEGDAGQKTFSDYFSEVKEQKPAEEKKNVIPESAVLLHNEITGGAGAPGGQFPQTEPEKQVLAPVAEEVAEHKAEDDSYYIWYRDSESNPVDTQTLSYEYELLYQATKEAEYKSKLKIYVTSFILFFSIVLILLIFSPLLYKLFFNPVESPKIENTQQDSPDALFQKAIPNVITENNTSRTQVEPPVDNSNNTQVQQQVTQQNTDQQQVTQQKVNQQQEQQNKSVDPQTTKEQKQVTPPVTKKEDKANQKNSLEQAGKQKQNQTQPPPKVESNLAGVTRNSMGWMDEKLRVIYIQLENGKFTIQESAWDSDAKAKKRIGAVESYGIKGLKGNVVKADLGAKGTWFRARFGEFSSLEEAHQKAVELRSKENMRIAMLFMSFLMFA